jgi:hypothetical protein
MAVDAGAIEWSHPAAFAALLVPIVVAWLARRGPRGQPVPAATVELWRRAASEVAAGGSSRRPRWPWPLVAALFAMVFGVLALAGPHRTVAPESTPWRIAIDASPSMFLPRVEPGSLADPTRGDYARAPRRIDRAVEAALERLERDGVRDEDREWMRLVGDRSETARAARPPDAWLEASRAPLAAPRFELFDQPRTLWLTDRATDKPEHAAVFACGGGAVVGPIASSGSQRTVWTGTALEERAGDPIGLAIDPGLPTTLRDLLAIWARARDATTDASGDVVLDVRSAGDPERGAATLIARDGWRANATLRGRGIAREKLDASRLEPWLVAASGEVVVGMGEGRIECAIEALEPLGADPAAFAVSWSRLFDAACLPARDVVAFAERADAGEARWTEPVRAPEPRAQGLRDDRRPAAILAACAAALALAAWCGALRSSRPGAARAALQR